MKKLIRKWLGINEVEIDTLLLRKELRKLESDLSDKSEIHWVKEDLKDITDVVVGLMDYLKLKARKEWVDDEMYPAPQRRKKEITVLSPKEEVEVNS